MRKFPLLVIFTVAGVLCLSVTRSSGRLLDMPAQILTVASGSNNVRTAKHLFDLNQGDEDDTEDGPVDFLGNLSNDFLHETSNECTVEVVNKLPGHCEKLGRVGRACVAGTHMNLFSEDCL